MKTAAGMLKLAGWEPGTPLLDPMCGSGTILLEARSRCHWNWPGWGAALLQNLNNFQCKAQEQLLPRASPGNCRQPLPIWGSDKSATPSGRRSSICMKPDLPTR